MDKATSAKVTLGMCKEMNIVDICRGMQTGWPQLIEAMKKLMEDPQFCNSFRNSYASGRGLSIGRPQQLVATLAIDPAWLTKSVPPSDVYGWSVWLTARVYEAAQTIGMTLKYIPELFPASKKSISVEVGALVREVLDSPHGLTGTSGNVLKLANDFLTHLKKISGDLEAAQTAYQTIGAAVKAQEVISNSKNMMTIISTHANAITASRSMNDQLENLQSAAARVTAFAVITNMAHAIQSLVAAWQVTCKQFEVLGHDDLEKLGDIAFLEDSLQLKSAAAEWMAFSEVIRDFLKRALIH